MGRRKKRTHGEGTIYQRSDNKYWVAQITIDGKRYTFTGKDRDEVLTKLQQMQVAYRRGEFIAPEKTTVADWLRQWLDVYKKPTVSQNTYQSYKNTIEKHVVPSIGEIQLQKLRPIHLQSLYAKLCENGMTRTAALAHAVIRQALGQAVEEGLIHKNVADSIDAPRWKPGKARVLSAEEMVRFLEAAADHPLYPAIALEAFTGMRRGEVLGLQWRDIDFDNGVAYVNKALVEVWGKKQLSTPKTENSARIVPIPEPILELLKEHRRNQEKAYEVFGWEEMPDFVFTTSNGTPIQPRNYNRVFQQICKKAGLEGVTPHTLRHTWATRLLEAGIPPRAVQELLGHASASTTEDIYSHVLPGFRRMVMGEISKLVGRLLQFCCNSSDKVAKSEGM